jgi:hypothetical protein
MIAREVPKNYDACGAPRFVYALWQRLHFNVLGDCKILTDTT